MNKFLKVAICAAAAVSVSLLSACDLLDSFLVHTHDMQFVAAKEATCTQDGNIEYYHCTKCGENFADEAGTTQLVTVVEKATGHDLEYVQPVEPTCTDGGSWGYYICSRCEEKFIDEDGETPATESELARPAKGHEYKVDVWENNAAGHWNLCDVCGERVNESAHTYGGDGICTVCGYVKGEDDVIYGNKEDIAEAELSIHFIELGNKYTGDCTLIKVGDTEVLIDAGSRQNSAPAIKEYVDEYCTDGKLEYVIATHADQDHIAGLVGNKSGGEYNGILYSYDIGTIIKFDRSNKSSGSTTVYGKFLAGVEYARSQGSAVYTGLQCWNGTDGAQRTYYLDEEQTVSLNILYNYYYENKSSDENNYSVCFLLTQQTDDGEKNYLFTGDLEEEGEEYLVQYNQLPEVELFKAGHHGSPTSSNDVLLSVIKPKNIVVCCCCGSDEYTDNNANQFPSQAFINRAAMYTENIYCTTIVSDNEDGYASMNGDVVFYYDKAEGEQKGSLKLWCSADTTKLKYTDWFAANRTWPEGGV
ncbi:MAG TPA: MBL fold metallo-hydrolase [Candidatus Coproplasma excrementavium]|nr:MBL fold metallo-hydrolase [Candidatus Coproplasma excrementavium]